MYLFGNLKLSMEISPNLPPSSMSEFLLLNASYEPLRICNWKKAILLIIKQKAELIAENVLKLVRYVKVPYRPVPRKPSKIAIFKRDKYCCQYCGSKKKLTLDHVVPKSRGGDNSWENLVTACEPCNLKKGNMLIEEMDGAMILKSPPQEPLTKFFNYFTAWQN